MHKKNVIVYGYKNINLGDDLFFQYCSKGILILNLFLR